MQCVSSYLHLQTKGYQLEQGLIIDQRNSRIELSRTSIRRTQTHEEYHTYVISVNILQEFSWLIITNPGHSLDCIIIC